MASRNSCAVSIQRDVPFDLPFFDWKSDNSVWALQDLVSMAPIHFLHAVDFILLVLAISLWVLIEQIY